MADAAFYLGLGKQVIPDLLDRELVAPWMEIEARVADQPYPGSSHRVEPHHLSQARGELEHAGVIEVHQTATRGGDRCRFGR